MHFGLRRAVAFVLSPIHLHYIELSFAYYANSQEFYQLYRTRKYSIDITRLSSISYIH